MITCVLRRASNLGVRAHTEVTSVSSSVGGPTTSRPSFMRPTYCQCVPYSTPSMRTRSLRPSTRTTAIARTTRHGSIRTALIGKCSGRSIIAHANPRNLPLRAGATGSPVRIVRSVRKVLARQTCPVRTSDRRNSLLFLRLRFSILAGAFRLFRPNHVHFRTNSAQFRPALATIPPAAKFPDFAYS